MIAGHHICFAESHFPRREQSVLTIKREIGVYNIRKTFLLRQSKKRRGSPESVP